MAIQWGAWEGSGNEMRVGIDVSWSSVSHNDTSTTATVKYYTQNRQSWNDSQTLNLSGAIDGTINFNNTQGHDVVTLRGTKFYTYQYPAGSYGVRPAIRTFAATLSGAFNGITPSVSVESDVPPRPIAAPAAPTNVSVSRISDSSQKVSWTNKSTAGEPWESITVQRADHDGTGWHTKGSPGGSATSFTDSSTERNHVYRYRVRANNSAGSSAYVETSLIYTSPNVPTSATRTDITDGQRITWVNKAGYSDYETDIVAWKNGTYQGRVGLVAAGVTSWDHMSTAGYTALDQWQYGVRHWTTAGVQGDLTSGTGTLTTKSAGGTTPPLAPTSLSPDGGVVIDPAKSRTLTWDHNSTDSSNQEALQVRHRIQGGSTWTTEAIVTSSITSYTLAAHTYSTGVTVEWQVATKGADPTWSSWSDSAIFSTVDTKKIPIVLDTATGSLEADLSGAPIAHLRMAADQSISTGSVTEVVFGLSDPQTMSNQITLTTDGKGFKIQKAGWYVINFNPVWDTAGVNADAAATYVYLNGTALSAVASVGIYVEKQLVANDEIKFRVYQATGVSHSLIVNNPGLASVASIRRVG